jgi:26S proteasome regulatory subunit N9
MHPILDALDGTPHDWIKKLLFTFNEGNIGKFESLAPVFPKEVCYLLIFSHPLSLLRRRYTIRPICRTGCHLRLTVLTNSPQPILQENYAFLRQKICLMALIESVFRRDAYDRTLSFQTIATETRLPQHEVEHLLMKALRYVHDDSSCQSHLDLMHSSRSLKLIRGSLDQVDEKATITWVQPRVLSREQIGGLASRLEKWCAKLNSVEQRVTPEVLATA